MIADTSKEAYASIYDKLGVKQQIVYEAIKEMGEATNEMIADFLGWPINRVTGRVTELHKFGMLEVTGLGKNKSGHSAKLWVIKDLNDKGLEKLANDCEA